MNKAVYHSFEDKIIHKAQYILFLNKYWFSRNSTLR